MASKNTQTEVVGRWRHRLINGEMPIPARRYESPPHGVVANVVRIRPQKYPFECEDGYFRFKKYYSLIYKAKIGTYEQWSRLTGISLDTLRERVRTGYLSMDQVMSKTPLNITDHAADASNAERYCGCEACRQRRFQDWVDSLTQIDAPNACDQGKIFVRNDGSYFLMFKGECLALNIVARILGIKYQTLHARVLRYGWTLEKAFGKNEVNR